MRPCCAPRNARRTLTPNGAADKPQRAESRRLSLPEVGLIRVVVRRFAPNKQRMPSAAPQGYAYGYTGTKRVLAEIFDWRASMI